jgi:hypothetical protein
MSMTASHLTPALILRELGKMNVSDLEGVLHKLQRLSATKKGALKANEARLLETINATLKIRGAWFFQIKKDIEGIVKYCEKDVSVLIDVIKKLNKLK